MKTDILIIAKHLKSTGYIFPGSEIYGGIANTFDYGPLGTLIKNNLKQLWIQKFVNEEENSCLIDTAIFMNSNVWKASGHVGNFNDVSLDCKACKKRSRADHLIENFAAKNNIEINFNVNDLNIIDEIVANHKIPCPHCQKFHWSNCKKFELILSTNLNLTTDAESKIYLRPETAQGIFINFQNITRSMRKKLPYAVAQIGKSFRNEITPGNFIFRTKEFEQMEIEYFCHVKDLSNGWKHYEQKIKLFLTKDLQINHKNIRIYNHPKEKLAHYSLATLDFEYNFSFGWQELWGLANRGNFDLKNHSDHSNESLMYLDPITNEKYFPSVIEPSVGVDRLLLAVFNEAYNEEIINNDPLNKRVVLKLPIKLAPYVACVNALSKELDEMAKNIHSDLVKKFSICYDKTGNIGKRYRRQDAIGTPFCITIDNQSLQDNTVTIRDRDSMEQKRWKISELETFLFASLHN